jgi:hypothetical protein
MSYPTLWEHVEAVTQKAQALSNEDVDVELAILATTIDLLQNRMSEVLAKKKSERAELEISALYMFAGNPLSLNTICE